MQISFIDINFKVYETCIYKPVYKPFLYKHIHFLWGFISELCQLYKTHWAIFFYFLMIKSLEPRVDFQRSILFFFKFTCLFLYGIKYNYVRYVKFLVAEHQTYGTIQIFYCGIYFFRNFILLISTTVLK